MRDRALPAMAIRELFSTTRPIDRTIEKVIDYNVTSEERLEREISEYEVIPGSSVERGFQRFLEAFDQGVRLGDAPEIGVWVSGFYGSGKSSFTKYLGFALDPRQTLKGIPFVDRLAERMPGELGVLLKSVARQGPTAVFMMDLGTDMSADSASVLTSNVLYRNVLTRLGFSRITKIADLEIRLERDGRLEDFERAYQARYADDEPWRAVHNDPLTAIPAAEDIVSEFYPALRSFRELEYEVQEDLGERITRMLDLIRRRTGARNILFIVDEVGQYVAPRKELILNLQGLVQLLKDKGEGRVWFVATAQQTLTEISDKAALNSPELFKLKDRFPIGIELEATDIREITTRRLLTKTTEAQGVLRAAWSRHADSLEMNLRLHDWPGASSMVEAGTFIRLYPLLPSRFQLLLDLIRSLARRTGGTGLRSAIRLVQDLLVDKSKALPRGVTPIADRPLGPLVAVDDIYDSLRADIGKEHPQAVEGVSRVARHPDFMDDPLAIRVAKAVAALQPIENRPRTVENIAALLYNELGTPAAVDNVRDRLNRLVDAREFGLVEIRGETTEQGGSGFIFLSDEVQPIQQKRDTYLPPQTDLLRARIEVLGQIFDPVPQVKLERTKTVRACLMLGKRAVAGEGGDITFRLEEVDPGTMEARLSALESETQTRRDYRHTVFWLHQRSDEVDERLLDICRSRWIQAEGGRSREIKADVARYLRSELRRADRARDVARAQLQRTLLKGAFVFQGMRRPVEELGSTPGAGCTAFLDIAAVRIFTAFAKVGRAIPADCAGKLLGLPRLDRATERIDPLKLVKRGVRPSIKRDHPALVEAMSAFRAMVTAAGSGRVQGSAILDLFSQPPYGWSKDATRYLFAALLVDSQVEFHGGDGGIKHAGPRASEAVKNTSSFNRLGVAPRDEPVPIEALNRASQRLETMFAVEVLPLEDQISRVVRDKFPLVLERAGTLPPRLRLLGLKGEERAERFLAACTELVREDAEGAASILGAAHCTIPEDERWSRAVHKALHNQGEQDLRGAARLVKDLSALVSDFRTVADLADVPAVGTIQEVLASEHFPDRMADLRSARRALTAAIAGRYAECLVVLRQEAAQVQLRVEARPSWLRIAQDDRAALLEMLDFGALAESPTYPVAELRTVLTRTLGLPAVEDEIDRQSDALAAPRPVDEEGGGDEQAGETNGEADEESATGEGPQPKEVKILLVIRPETLTSQADVERWIEALKRRLLDRVAHGPIRLVED